MTKRLYNELKALIALTVLFSFSVFTGCDKDDDAIPSVPDEPTVNNFVMTATGQVNCYNNDGDVLTGLVSGDAFYGQDANYLAIFPAIDPMFMISGITNEAGNTDYPYFWTSTSGGSDAVSGYYYADYIAFGYAVDWDGNDIHGAGAVRFDTKVEDGPAAEDEERIYNYVRLVRDAN